MKTKILKGLWVAVLLTLFYFGLKQCNKVADKPSDLPMNDSVAKVDTASMILDSIKK